VAARAEFFLLTKTGKDACSEAYVGYCRDREHEPRFAIPWYERALASGCVAGEVHNNLAVAYSIADRSHDPETRFAMAEAQLNKALARLPDSPTVRLNLLLHELIEAEIFEDPVSQRAVDFAGQLTAEFPDDGYLHERAARLVAFASRSQPERLSEALSWLRRAVVLGHGPSSAGLAKDPFWAPLRTSPEFAALLNDARVLQPGQRSKSAISRILEPLSCASRYPALPVSD
jgi:tetratricopeptide (TPR) repeat protein